MSEPHGPSLDLAGRLMGRDPTPTGPADLFRLLVESVSDYAIFALDATGYILSWNSGAQRFKGYTAEEIIGRHFSVFYPEEDVKAGKPSWELTVAIRDGRLEDEGWRVRKDGSRFWANVVITALRDEGGEVIGFAKVTRDLTTRRDAEQRARELAASEAARAEAERRAHELNELTVQLEQQAVELEAQTDEAQALAEELEQANDSLQTVVLEAERARDAARDAEQFTREVLESIADPFVVHDADWRFRYINQSAAMALGDSRHANPADLVGQVVWDAYPQLVGTAFEREMRRAQESRTATTFEAFYPERGEWSQMFCYPLPDGGLATQWKNITARKQAEESARYLAQASAVLGSTLEYETTVVELARLVVPDLADWCAVDILDGDGNIRRLAVAHVDAEKVTLARELADRYPPDPNAAAGAARVIRTGEPEFHRDIPDELLAAAAVNEEHLGMIRALGLRSVIVVPLAARGRTLGALSLASAESRRRYGDADLSLAIELGRRTGLAVDNARLFADARAAMERTARLQSVTAGLASVMTADAVAETVIREGMAALGATNGVLCLLTEAGDELEIVHAVGLGDDTRRAFRRFPVAASLPLSDAVRSGAPIYLQGKADVAERYPALREMNERASAEAWTALPLTVGGRCAGGIALGFAEARSFTSDDRAFAMALAQQAAQAIERSRLLNAERAARSEAESANRVKSEFLATMSHELRTPLNAIAGYADLLAMGVHGPVTDAQRAALSRIQRSQRHLQSVIGDILNFARLEAGHLTVDLRDVPVRDLIAGVEPLVEPQIQTKGLEFDVEPCDPALTARADAEKVQQVLLNLLSNAIKFTPAGGRITVACRRNGTRVEVAVRDTGNGIPADKLEVIFEPFVQLGRTLATSRDGTGLGLSISRDLSRAMGGELTVESEVGHGSTFTLSLPTPTET